MFFNPRKLFVIVGYPRSGKKRVLQELFARKHFFPLKEPITSSVLNGDFVVINMTNRRKRTSVMCSFISRVMQYHAASSASGIIMLSLVLDNGLHDAGEMIRYLNASGYTMHYLVLRSSWSDKQLISDGDLQALKSLVSRGTVHVFEKLVTQSGVRFEQRQEELAEVINEVLGGCS